MMFTSFFANADLLALFLLCYAESVALSVAIANKDRMHAIINYPVVVRSFYASAYVFAALPLLFVCAFYIGSYSGFWGGVIGFFGVSIVTGVIGAIFNVRGNLGIHLLIAPIPLIYGYMKIASTWG